MATSDRATDGHPRDPGLQLERTSLAWRRTGLALTIAVVLVARAAAEVPGAAAVLISSAVVALAALSALVSFRRRALVGRSRRDPTVQHVLDSALLPACVAGAVAFLCLVELLVILMN